MELMEKLDRYIEMEYNYACQHRNIQIPSVWGN